MSALLRSGTRTALFTLLALVLGLGAGIVIAPTNPPTNNTKFVSDDYDLEVVCRYTSEMSGLSANELFSPDRPHGYHLQALISLLRGIERTEAELPQWPLGYNKSMVRSDQAQDVLAGLKDVQKFCDSKNDA